jgi:hypothetical protein
MVATATGTVEGATMSGAVAIVIVIGAVAALYAVQTLIGKTTNAASRQVFKKTYRSGRSEISRTLAFSAPVAPKILEEKIVERVNAHASAPAVAGGLYLARRSPGLLVFEVGNKVNTAMRARVDLQATASGCTGTFGVTNWKESGAVVMGHSQVGKLIDRIKLAVADAGGSAREG